MPKATDEEGEPQVELQRGLKATSADGRSSQVGDVSDGTLKLERLGNLLDGCISSRYKNESGTYIPCPSSDSVPVLAGPR
jgi:hypothetical protein